MEVQNAVCDDCPKQSQCVFLHWSFNNLGSSFLDSFHVIYVGSNAFKLDSGSQLLDTRTSLLFKVYSFVLFAMQEGRQSFLQAMACTFFRLLPHEYMIVVVQLHVFPTIIMPFRNNGKKLCLSSVSFFVLVWFLALELREKISLPRAWVDELPC